MEPRALLLEIVAEWLAALEETSSRPTRTVIGVPGRGPETRMSGRHGTRGTANHPLSLRLLGLATTTGLSPRSCAASE